MPGPLSFGRWSAFTPRPRRGICPEDHEHVFVQLELCAVQLDDMQSCHLLYFVVISCPPLLIPHRPPHRIIGVPSGLTFFDVVLAVAAGPAGGVNRRPRGVTRYRPKPTSRSRTTKARGPEPPSVHSRRRVAVPSRRSLPFSAAIRRRLPAKVQRFAGRRRTQPHRPVLVCGGWAARAGLPRLRERRTLSSRPGRRTAFPFGRSDD